MTYQNQQVIDYITDNFIPWRVSYLDDTDLVAQYRVEWTPCVMVLDAEGVSHHSSTGYLEPEEFIAQLAFGIARIAYHDKNFVESAKLFGAVTQQYPQTHAAAKAVWFSGISLVQATGDKAGLKEVYLKLKRDYPHSIWVEKSLPWGG